MQGSSQRFALPALGRVAGRRPTGKMLRRRKMLGIAPDSPASGARFVGCGLTKMILCFLKVLKHLFQFAQVTGYVLLKLSIVRTEIYQEWY